MGVNRTRPLVVLSREEHYAKNLRDRFSPDFANFGLEHGLGWLGIIHTLHNRLAPLQPDYRLQQIKKKFGTLRYYCTFPSAGSKEAFDQVLLLIQGAEQQTSVTCEICGEPGRLTSEGWSKVRCSDCMAKEDEAARSDKA